MLRAWAIQAFLNPPELELIRTHLKGDGENRAVIFLGDNVYPRGLPNQTSSLWSQAHESLSAQLELVKNFPGKIFFIPGNRDWANGGKEGLEYVKNQRRYIEDFLQRKNIFLPKKGKPGPVEIDLTDDIELIIIDS